MLCAQRDFDRRRGCTRFRVHNAAATGAERSSQRSVGQPGEQSPVVESPAGKDLRNGVAAIACGLEA
jgi:hypothetical protein